MNLNWIFGGTLGKGSPGGGDDGCFPAPPKRVPRPMKRPDAGKGCFPKAPSPKWPGPPTPMKHPLKSPAPNRKGR
jgi:hypothetical protein